MQAKSHLLFSTVEQSTVVSPTVDQSAPHVVEKLMTGALFTLTVFVTVACAPVYSSEVNRSEVTSNEVSSKVMSSKKVAQNVAPTQSLPDGTYLYGESAIANQVGKTYMVIDVRDRQVVGAFYNPSSSFDCFRGKVQAKQLALNVANSYDHTSYTYAVPLKTNTQVANRALSASSPVGLLGYHRIHEVSQEDHKVLAICQARYSTIGQHKL
jgi:hypothetical protein